MLPHPRYVHTYATPERRQRLVAVLEQVAIEHNIDINIAGLQSKVREWARTASKDDPELAEHPELQNVEISGQSPAEILKQRSWRQRKMDAVRSGDPDAILWLENENRKNREKYRQLREEAAEGDTDAMARVKVLAEREKIKNAAWHQNNREEILGKKQAKARANGVAPLNYWTPQEEQALKDGFAAGLTSKAIVEKYQLERTDGAVYAYKYRHRELDQVTNFCNSFISFLLADFSPRETSPVAPVSPNTKVKKLTKARTTSMYKARTRLRNSAAYAAMSEEEQQKAMHETDSHFGHKL